MLMRGELSTPAMGAGWEMPAAEPGWHQVFGILRSSDLLVVVVFATIGLLAALWLTLSLPFSDDIAAFLAQSS